MKPEEESKKILKYTKSIAKLIEFDVPEEDRNINISNNPEELFTLVIGILGDISEEIITNKGVSEINENNIRFCASFFDSYKNTERLHFLDNYSLLIGATAYYLCSLPGSTSVLINKLNIECLNLNASKLDLFLYWILAGNYCSSINISNTIYSLYLSNIASKIKYFFQTGSDEILVYEACKNLQDFVYTRHNPRELFISDLIYAVCIKKIRNSCWLNLPTFSNLSKEKWSSSIKKTSFIKELWPSQLLLGRNNVFNGQSAVIQMPTSAGKTKSTEIIIRSSFLAERTNIAVIVAPFKALCNEIRNDFIKAFYQESNISIDAISDALEYSELTLFSDNSKKHIIILTPEKLYYLLTQQQSFTESIGLIIFDEGHQFDTGERGVTYELLLTELKKILPLSCQKILISAVIHNATQISNWLTNTNNVVQGKNTLPTERSVGIVNFDYGIGQINFIDTKNNFNQDYFVPKIIPQIEMPLLGRERKKRFFPDINDSNSIALYLALQMSVKENIAIFCGKKDSVNSILSKANDYYKRNPNGIIPKIDKLEKHRISKLIENNFGKDSIEYEAACKGIFAHHADIPHGIKIAIEYAMHESLISFIVCTSTLAQGVNLPIKYLFIASTQQGGDRIKVRDFHNLIGRVGRAGKLTEGCIIFTNPNIYPKDSFFWNQTMDLFDPEKSEDCTSSLLSIFKPFYQDNKQLKFKTIKIIIDFYFDEDETIETIAKAINSKYPDYEITQLEKQIEKKFSYIEKIENFLMLLGENLDSLEAEKIASSTLAYKMADELQKKEIINLFVGIAEKIETKGIDKKQLPIYAKTLRGLKQTISLKENLFEKKEIILSCVSAENLLDVLWDFFINLNIQNDYFNYYPDKNRLKKATKLWIKGCPYSELFRILEGEKINGRDYIKLESCVNIFENGLGYSGGILVNTITEIFKSYEEEQYNSIVDYLNLFQYQIKYGLPTIESILLYEWGFCDRVIAQEIATILPSCSDKYLMKINILKEKEKILEILNKYPSYYLSVLDQIIG